MEIPTGSFADFSKMYQDVKNLTTLVLTACHDPDFQTTQENIREFFSKLEEETFQLKLFSDEIFNSHPAAINRTDSNLKAVQ